MASQVRQKYNMKVGRLADTAGTAPGLILFSGKDIQANQFVWELLARLVHRDKETFSTDQVCRPGPSFAVRPSPDSNLNFSVGTLNDLLCEGRPFPEVLMPVCVIQ